MKPKRQLTSSMEDYLEAILAAADAKGRARVTDIKNLLNVKTPSVTGALFALSQKKLTLHERYGKIQLTPHGKNIALRVKKKHSVISGFLRDVLGVNLAAADVDACKIEHAISNETFKKLISFVNTRGKSKQGKKCDK